VCVCETHMRERLITHLSSVCKVSDEMDLITKRLSVHSAGSGIARRGESDKLINQNNRVWPRHKTNKSAFFPAARLFSE
jgi:hypothetical protein